LYNWHEDYKSRLCSPRDAVKLIKSGDNVVFGHCAAEPGILVKAMIDNAEAYRGVKISHMQTMGDGLYTRPEYKDNFKFDGWFLSPGTRDSVAQGHGDMTPNFYHEAPEWIRNGIWDVDVLLTTVSLPDKRGFVSCGVSADYTREGINKAKKVIVQVNENMPYTFGDTLVPISRFDAIVEANAPLPELIPQAIDEKELAIGRYCASLIPDGATISLGIGAIPDAICQALYDKKELGVHSDMFSDGIVDLYEAGIITNNLKSMDKGKMIVSFVMGTKKLYQFVDRNPVVEFKDAEYANHPYMVAKQSKMVCINSAVSVDFMGQIVSASIGRCQFSGAGGQPSLMRGVSMSRDRQGKGIIAMTASVQDISGKIVSRIRPYIPEGSEVSLVREDTDYVITEYGIARLKGLPLSERARVLINIADPQFSDELKEEYEKRFLRQF